MTGSVVKLDDTYVVTVNLFDTNTAQMLYAHHIEAESVRSCLRPLKNGWKSTCKVSEDHVNPAWVAVIILV